MSDARDNGDWGKPQPDEAALSARLQRLNEGLGQTRQAGRDPSDGAGAQQTATASGYARGFRLSSELVAGVLVGAGIGWLFDRLLGVSPWGLTVFLLLGFAAGVLNVMRSAGLVASPTLNDRRRQGSDRSSRSASAQRKRRDHASRSDPSIPDTQLGSALFPGRPPDQFHQFRPLYVHYRGIGLAPLDRRDQQACRRTGPATVNCGNVLRVCGRHGAQLRGYRGNEILSLRVHALHVRAVRQFDRAHPLFIHGNEPADHHGDFGAAGFLPRGWLRVSAKPSALSESFRAEGRTETAPSGHR